MAFMASDGARQFKVLLRKNLLLKTRRPCATCFEFMLPTVLFMLLAYIRSVYKLKDSGPYLFETAPIYPLGYLIFPEDASSQALVDMKTGRAPMIPGVHNGTQPTLYGSRVNDQTRWSGGTKEAEVESEPSMYETIERELVCMDGTSALIDSAVEPLVGMLLGDLNGEGGASPSEAGDYVASMLEQAQNGTLRSYMVQALEARRTYLESEWKTDGEAWAVWLDAEFRKLAAALDSDDTASLRGYGEDYVNMLCNSSLIPNGTRLGKHTNWSGTVSWSDRLFQIGNETVRWDEQEATFGNCTLNWVQRKLNCTGEAFSGIDWSNHSLEWNVSGHNMSISWDDYSANFGNHTLDWTHKSVSWGDWSFGWSSGELNLTGAKMATTSLAAELKKFSDSLETSGFAAWLRGVNVSQANYASGINASSWNATEALSPLYSWLDSLGTAEDPAAEVDKLMSSVALVATQLGAMNTAQSVDSMAWWMSHFMRMPGMAGTWLSQMPQGLDGSEVNETQLEELRSDIARTVYKELYKINKMAQNETLREEFIAMVNQTAKEARIEIAAIQEVLENWNESSWNYSFNLSKVGGVWGFNASELDWNTSKLNASHMDVEYFMQDIRSKIEKFRNETVEYFNGYDDAAKNKTLLGRIRHFADMMNGKTIPQIDAEVIPEMEAMWRQECPSLLNATYFGEKFASMNSRCPFYRSQMDSLKSANLTGALAAANYYLEMINETQVMQWIAEAEAAVNGINVSEVRTAVTTIVQQVQSGDTSSLTGDASLGKELRKEYLKARGLTPCPGDEPEGQAPSMSMGMDPATYLQNELMSRRILVSPNTGEARQLVDLLMVELVMGVSTATTGESEFMKALMRCPIFRSGVAQAGNSFMQDRFMFMESEAAVEEYARTNADDVLLAVVFRNTDAKGNFPPGQADVEYAIRVHAQLLPDTSRIMRLSRNAMFGESRLSTQPYIDMGFVQLQETMGRAIARLQAQRDVKQSMLGLYAYANSSNLSLGSEPEPSPEPEGGARRLQTAETVEATPNATMSELAINMAAMSRTQMGRELTVGVEQFPNEFIIIDGFIRAIQHTLPMFMILGWIYSVSLLVRAMVYEKEERLRDVMRIMGLKTWVYWSSWAASATIQLAGLSMLISAWLVGSNVLKYSDFTCVFFFFFLFSCATVSLCMLLSACFNRAKVAAACAGLSYYGLYAPYSLYTRFEPVMSIHQKNAMCLMSSTGMAIGTSIIARWELTEEGLQWSNFWTRPPVTGAGSPPTDGHSMGHICMMLFIDIFLYQALAWYIEKVFPGSLGLPQPFYFPLMPSYWKGNVADAGDGNEFDADSAEKDANAREGFYWEAPVATAATSVQIRGLEKVFPNGKRALNGVNLDMHHGTILGLLGHNGAGKSTTMAIMTGLYAPTKGDVKVNGVSVKHDSQGVRKQLGVCLQHNALYENFTVQEHLELFCCLKCVPQKMVKAEVDQLLAATGLTPKRNAPSKALSGGMKRKLSIGIALSGGSPVVTLDEPTAGVDATSRRDIWQMLQGAKATRTILLSTHFMDEADILSDRIAVIAEGQLTAVGSGMSLKRHFADGYMLTVVVTGTSSAPVTAAVRAAVPEATFAGSRGREVSYVLPFASRSKFPALFEVLQDEKNQASLGIETYGLSAATMEEVFLRASSLHEAGLHGVIRNDGEPSTASPSSGTPPQDKHVIEVDNAATDAGAKAEAEETNSVHSGELVLKDVITRQCSDEVDDRPRSPQCMEQDEPQPAPLPKKASAATASTGLEEPQQVDDLAPVANRLEALDRDVSEGKLGGVKLQWQQFLALFRKRAISVKRDRKAWASQLLLPALFVLMALVIARIMSVKQEAPPILLTSDMFVGEQGGFGGNRTADRSMRKAEANYIPFADAIHSNQSASLMSAFQGALTPMDRMQVVDGHMSRHLIENRGTDSFNQAVGAVSIEEHGNTTQVTLWFDNVAYHIVPVMVDYWNNARFRMLGYEKVQVRVWNHPLPKTEQLLQEEMSGASQVFTDLWVAITIILAMGFIPASFVVYLVHEKATSGKHQQLLSGVKPTMYWISSYFWDMTNFLIPVAICVLIMAAFNVEAYAGDNLPAVAVLLLIYGACMTPMMYCVEPLFSVPSTAYVTLICINIFTGTLSTLSVSVLELYQQEAPELKPITVFVKNVFPWVLPNYCLGRGMMQIAMNHYMNFVAEEFGLCIPNRGCYVNPLSYQVVGHFLVPLVIMAPVWFLLRIFIEWGFCLGRARKAVRRMRGSNSPPKVFDEDADVLAETQRVESTVADAAAQGGDVVDNLVITGLEKSFVTKSRCCRGSNLFHAVRGVNVGVPRGECFGLLGVNGAGKTTTMRMITGDTEITSGDVLVSGHSVHTHRDKARQHLGYCPQFDALPDKLTVKETVALYARIRGVAPGRVQQCVQDMIKCMCLEAHQNQCCEYLSGGNKRKLSTALALIGDPDVVLLDEPSTGVDVGARRFLWEVIGGLRERGHAIVLTSHAMEECQVLCTRLTIMVHGQFRCLGSPMQLKSKYGGGYTLTIKADLTHDSALEADNAASACAVPVEESRVDSKDNKSEGSGTSKPFGETIVQIRSFMSTMVPQAKLTEQSVGLLRYAIGGQRQPDGMQRQTSQADIPLAHIFKVFEESTQRGGQLYKCVSDYSISQTSLEEVFLHFSQEAEMMLGAVANRVADKAKVPDSPSPSVEESI